MTREQLDAIRKRCEAATPGPYDVEYTKRRCQVSHFADGLRIVIAVFAEWCLEDGFTPPPHGDAEFYKLRSHRHTGPTRGSGVAHLSGSRNAGSGEGAAPGD